MDKAVAEYIKKLPKWQVEVCNALRNIIYKVIPAVEERIQYGKPHYLKNGHYACVIHAAKDKVSFMLFNAAEVEEIRGVLKAMSSPDRKTVTITEGQKTDVKLLTDLLTKTSKTL